MLEMLILVIKGSAKEPSAPEPASQPASRAGSQPARQPASPPARHTAPLVRIAEVVCLWADLSKAWKPAIN
eukprot:11394523-Heterocapsa_arctica.AAC.1